MPIQVLWGDDFAGSDKAIESLVKDIIDPSWSSLNLSRLDGSEPAQVKQALEESQTPPFGSGGRIVLLKRSPICNNCPKELNDLFENIINLIPEKTYLILSNPSKPDKRLKSTKAIEKLAKDNKAIVKSYQLPAVWDKNGQKLLVENVANEFNLKISEDAIFSLVDSIGSDSKRLHSELEKLCLFIEAKNRAEEKSKSSKIITLEDINQLIHGRTTNSLEVGNQLINNELGNVISLLDSLLDKGEPGLRILATLTGQVRGCLWVSLLEKEGEQDVNKIAKTAGINNPKRIYIIRKQIKGKSPKQFLKLLNQLLEIEASLKRGALPKQAFRDGLLTESDEKA